jgi:hypothetical protein
MGVAVDEPRRDDMSFRVYDFVSGPADFANRSDVPIFDSDVGLIPRQARAVDDSTSANNQIVCHLSSF